MGGRMGLDAEHLMSSYVDRNGDVDYERARSDPRLAAAAKKMAQQDASALEAADAQAFWINSYNLAVVLVVLRVTVPGRTLQLAGWHRLWARFRFFLLVRVQVAGRSRSLFGLERVVLRQGRYEPRLHFALVCGAQSCPPLKRGLYAGHRLEQDLEQAARAFVRPGAGYTLDRDARVVVANRIFRMYRRHFRHVGGVLGAIQRWGPEDDAQWTTDHAPRVRFARYDWNLNQAEPKSAPVSGPTT